MDHPTLKAHLLETKLGTMVAVSDDHGLYHLEFIQTPDIEQEIARLKAKNSVDITPDLNAPILSIEAELKSYFQGALTTFKTPIHISGTPFQALAWQELLCVPYGQTRSYAFQAAALGRPTACRAVANANGANKMAIIIPCHRIVNSNGKLGGYAAGVSRKEWLINHEKQMLSKILRDGALL